MIIESIKERLNARKWQRENEELTSYEHIDREIEELEEELKIIEESIEAKDKLDEYLKSVEEHYKNNPLRNMTKDEIENGFEYDLSDEDRENEEAVDTALSNIETNLE